MGSNGSGLSNYPTVTRYESVTMDHESYVSNPFSSNGLWRLSKFTLESLQPLEPLPWNENLPGKWYLSVYLELNS